MACCRSGSVQEAVGMCCPRRSRGCPRSGTQEGLGMLLGSGEQSWGSFWVTLWTNCSQNCYMRCCLKESYFPSHVPDFSKPSVPVKNFQVVGFGVRGEKAEGKLEAGVGSWVSAGLCKEALYSYNEGSAEKCFQLDTQMIKQALNKSCGSTAGKEILLRLKINILCCMYAKLFFYF